MKRIALCVVMALWAVSMSACFTASKPPIQSTEASTASATIGNAAHENTSGDLPGVGVRAVLGGVAVEIKEVSVRKVEVKRFREISNSKDDLLAVKVVIHNTHEAKKIDYNPWFSGYTTRSHVRDDHNNSYKLISFGIGDEVIGQVKRNESIYPRKSLSDLLICEQPVANAEFVFIDLPASNLGGEGVFRFSIPLKLVLAH